MIFTLLAPFGLAVLTTPAPATPAPAPAAPVPAAPVPIPDHLLPLT